MKRWISMVLAAVMLIGCFTSCTPKDTADGSSQATSSQSASSDETYVPYYEVPEGYQDVNADIIKAGGSKGWDVSEYFDMEAEGYAIYDGVYMVNAEVLKRLTEVPVVGDAKVIWTDYKILDISAGSDSFTGHIPVDKLHDPVYMSMHLPSEVQTYMSARINPANMYPYNAKYDKIMTIGAIYKVAGEEIPDDAEITVCIGKTSLFIRTEEDGWYIARQTDKPSRPDSLYPIPWENQSSTAKVPSTRVVEYDDHYEIKLLGSMLNGTYQGLQAGSKGDTEEAVLHFWGGNVDVHDKTVQGVVAGYTAWIKEEEYVGKVAATVGADWRTPQDAISQAFSGYNHKLTTEPRVIFGHTVGPNSYDTLMDTDLIQQWLGLK